MDEIATKCGAPVRPVRAPVRRPGRSATPSAPRPARPSAPTSTTLAIPVRRPRRTASVPAAGSSRPIAPTGAALVSEQVIPGGLRRAVCDPTGLVPKERRGLLGETAPLLQSSAPAALASVELVGLNTFAVQGEGSNERSNE
ncbi:hypothetical protein [Salinispora arenicola]|uniref:hypothetical protein n=1 Tax=Salinispora arenicola TaxID=168697 RepID=UPI0004B8AFBC|nr:hypothetical protein [Salinispora arenicola]